MAEPQAMEEILTIQQMVQATGLSAHTLRYYERAGIMQPVSRSNSNGYRFYTQRDVNWIHFIKCLRATGMHIRDIQRYTEFMRQGEGTLPARLELLREHRRQVIAQLQQVEQYLSAITTKIAFYEHQSNQYTYEKDMSQTTTR